ncbi:hypothetical protein R80B4_00969 [Fibrobacteres bacterium R8-0-B4]
MARNTGVTEKTFKRLVLDSSVVYLNWGSTDPANPRKMLGACRGGNTFNIEREWRDMPFDGIGGIVRGGRRLVGATVTLTANLVEIDKDILKTAMPGADYTELTATIGRDGEPLSIPGEKQYSLRAMITAAIPDFQYNDVAIVGKYSGTELPLICVVKNALVTSNFELTGTDKDESVLAVTFSGSYGVNDLDNEPWEVIWPEREPI